MTTPTPSRDGLERTVADLLRRVKDLETGPAARPAASAQVVAAYPYSAGDVARWAGFSSFDYRVFYAWWARMEWSALDVAIRGTTTGDRSGQWRLCCDGEQLFEADVQSGNTADVLVERVVDLTAARTESPRALSRFTIEGHVIGGSAGGFFIVPERLLLTGVRAI